MFSSLVQCKKPWALNAMTPRKFTERIYVQKGNFNIFEKLFESGACGPEAKKNNYILLYD